MKKPWMEDIQSIVDSFPLPYQSMDAKAFIVHVNKAWLDLLGYSREEVINKWFGDFLTPDSANLLRKQFPIFLTEGKVRSVEYTLIGKDGRELIVSYDGNIEFDEKDQFKRTHCFFKDITKQKRVRQSLQESEERYRSIVEESPVVINRFLPDGTITFVNQEYSKLFGKKCDELIGTNIQFTIPEENREKVMSGITSLTEESPVRTFENKVIKHDGEIRWVRWTDRALFDEKGRVTGYQSFGEDITERKQTEQQLQKSEEKYRTLFENMLEGFAYCRMLYDKNKKPIDFVYLDVNAAFERITNTKTVIGKPVTQVYPGIKEAFPQLFEIYSRVALTGKPESFDIDFTPIGKWLHLSVYSILKETFIATFTDITERKQAEQTLRLEQEKAQKYLDIAGVVLVASNKKGEITLINQKGCQVLGYEEDELIGRNWFETCLPERMRKEVFRDFRKIIAGEIESLEFYENPILTKSGEEKIMAWHNSIVRDEKGNITGSLSSGEDITYRRQAEQALRQYEHIVSSSSDMLALLDKHFNYLAANTAYMEAFNLIPEKLIGNTVVEVFGEELFNTVIKPNADRCMVGEEVNYQDWFDFPAYGRRYMDITYYPYYGEDKKIMGFVVNGRNITERKKAEESIQQEKEKAQKYLDIAEVMIVALNEEGNITLVNQKGSQILGYEKSELLGRNWFDTCVPEQDRKQRRQVFRKIIAGEAEHAVYDNENTILTRSGEERIIAWHDTVLRDEKGNNVSTLSSGEDITKRVRAQQLLNALNRATVVMGAAQTHQEIFNAIAIELKQLDISCLLLQPDETQDKVFFKYLSYESAALKAAEKLVGIKHEDFSVSIDAVDFIREVVREKKTLFADKTEQIVEQMIPKITKKLLAQVVKTLNVQKSISVPLIVEDQVMGMFTFQSDNLTQEDIPAATAFADQLSSAWNKIKLLQDLRKTVEGTIHTIAATVEVRDPYTAGHQTRVADLAVAIASEMKLSGEQIEGLKMVGVIHDLGKVQIPAEILSKPGKISELEYEIIQTHPQVGFDLLKNIEFPWPIAEMVLQHHEMMDGSGYPQGLKGEEILLEARILAVADIVEAMSSHRPYRPALGIEKALKQIRQDKGTLLDPRVVNACLKIFKEGYKLLEN